VDHGRGGHLPADLRWRAVVPRSRAEEFRGTFAPTLADCQGENGVEIIDVRADGIHYFEGDDYLIIGVKFQGSSTKSRRFVPLFNGRFTGRMET
jgi:hypothetical protein